MCILFELTLIKKKKKRYFYSYFYFVLCEKLSRWEMIHKVWKVQNLCWVSFIPDLLLQLNGQTHVITKFLIHLLSLENFSTAAMKKDTFFYSLFFFSFLSILTPTLVLPVQRLLFLSLLVVHTATNTKPLTGTSESDVNNSQRIGFDSIK